MNSPAHPERDDLLEKYLDGLLNDEELAAFAEVLRTDPARRRQVELQARIDGALGQLFQVTAPTREELAATLARVAAPRQSVPFQEIPRTSAASSPRPGSRLYWGVVGVAAAAAIAWVIVTFASSKPGADQPFFAAQPLAEIYRAAVASGFEPSYDCREPERFAAAFAQRQGKPLRLLAMPPGMVMLGLGYVGGLSRQTTAMLCRVDGKPVMVFVDRASADQSSAVAGAGEDLHVFRDERDGLIYYEVTPWDEPRVTRLFAPATLTGGPLAARAAPAVRQTAP